ncbi:proteasome component pre3 [Colletotrichum tofieldiae]|nr:proteasome component pre3 [Colletotrichum tofieldiae]
MEFTTTGMLNEDGIHVDMERLKKGEVKTTTGAYIANRVTDKLTQVHDTIWCCRSGSAADTQAVADIVQYQLGLAGLIIAGWDERHGGQVYSIPLGGSLHKQSYAIGGSGSTYIYGYCDEHWKEGMEEKDAVEFVKGSLKEAIKWDGSSGGVIRMVVLTAQGAQRHLYLPDEDYTVKH